jgi:hypothetical protein
LGGVDAPYDGVIRPVEFFYWNQIVVKKDARYLPAVLLVDVLWIVTWFVSSRPFLLAMHCWKPSVIKFSLAEKFSLARNVNSSLKRLRMWHLWLIGRLVSPGNFMSSIIYGRSHHVKVDTPPLKEGAQPPHAPDVANQLQKSKPILAVES